MKKMFVQMLEAARGNPVRFGAWMVVLAALSIATVVMTDSIGLQLNLFTH